MSLNKLARGMVEIPKGVNTSHSDNSNFMNVLERTNALLIQFLSATEDKRMIMRTELEESYFNITLYNLKDSIKHKVEQDMWNNLFKKCISELQGKMKSKDKVEMTKAQSELSLFLDEAMGFYSKFLDALSLIYNIRLPGRPGNVSKVIGIKDSRSGDEVNEEDFYYIAQHCLVHLGDLSRYHNLNKLARLNYQWAVQLNPTSGHAYNQLAILESSSVSQVLSHTNYSHILRTILYYDFANTCQTPFPVTRINLDALLRHIHQESVSELLTSNNSTDAVSCLSSFAVAWLHTYAAMRLRSNIHRCRQLQQRIVEWTSELVKYHDVSVHRWRDFITIIALQCALHSSTDITQEKAETPSWNINLQQFTQDIINALCHSMVSISHDIKLFENLLSESSCISILIVFLSWINQYLVNGNDAKPDKNKINLSIPFGEQFVKLLNILQTETNIKFGSVPNLPTDLPELKYLMGYEPLKIPCKRFNIFSHEMETENAVNIVNKTNIRKSFILSSAFQIAAQYSSLLVYNDTTRAFVSVPRVVEAVPQKKLLKTEPVIVTRKPVNVALASIRNNAMETNNGMDARKNVPIRVVQSTNIAAKVEPPAAIVTDVKIAKCIQDHIALEITSSPVRQDTSFGSANSHTKEDSHGMAPAPGLILSSNLPPEYKTMTSTPEAVEPHATITTTTTNTHVNDLIDMSKIVSVSATANILSKVPHSYNPNREQFEKDLPPRFANKRCSSQKENKTGFKSLNYWDSTSTYPSNQSESSCEVNLTKKESEMMVMPPTVPSSWLNDDSNDMGNRRPMETGNIAMAQHHFQMADAINQQQQRTNFNNSLQQNPMNMFTSVYPQFQNKQPMPDQDSQMQHFLQTTSSNQTNFPYQTSSDMMDHNRVKFDQMFLQQNASMHNFPPIPPPPTQQHQQHQLSGFMTSGTNLTQNNSYDQFSLSRANNYDKPVFSTSNQSGFMGGGGYNTSQMMQQQITQHQQQQQKHSHQVRSNNPLLNLLPGFTNEVQR